MKRNNRTRGIIFDVLAIAITAIPLLFACNHEVVYAMTAEEATCVHDGIENMVCEKCQLLGN